MTARRTVRTKPRNGLAIRDVLATALLSELCSPSTEFWLVSGWVSDVVVIDNGTRQFDAVLGTDPSSDMTLSEVLGELTQRGTEVHVAVRDVDHNEIFVDRLRRSAVPGLLHLYSNEYLHEKLMVGGDWLLSGSMNFTWNGTQVNEESMELQLDQAEAARHRLELRTRWIGART
ncbi:phospholipase D-like domain-containing protein DpdK [Gordonia rubripertincta]|uniref:Phospholipase D-like domain-containing protein DpdK n=1 Tax=Gordonia rubripertincta TaxID=36822 RepID=A0ABT4MZ17_GORRU|nr:phospholipase D-like domain-containing protein DpdK [Gordonia rubripertincta]MCZ4552237.1 phospholipase D-like domain-containing protein DpdK [Gordonia rubripertincta]